ncbi:MAG: FkbM family methyltransferase [Bacteroidota bacterium]
MSKFKALATLLIKPRRLSALLSHGHKGYLFTIGWFKAFDSRQAVDAAGLPIPWVTYSFIDFIKPRLNKELSVFEYGSGNSTLFYAKSVRRVVSVEHDEEWYHKLLTQKVTNAEMIFCRLDMAGAYCKKAASLPEKFDIIIVDGRDRVNCCKQGINGLTDRGVIVLDDSEREAYSDAWLFLTGQGFKEISFSGISPGLFYEKSTTVFYKTNNCLGI